MYFGDNMSMYKIADIISDIRPKFPTFEKMQRIMSIRATNLLKLNLQSKKIFCVKNTTRICSFLSVNWNVFLCQMFSIKKF